MRWLLFAAERAHAWIEYERQRWADVQKQVQQQMAKHPPWSDPKHDILADLRSAHDEATAESKPIYLPSDLELMAARGAIVSLISSIANGNLKPRQDVMDEIIKSVVRSLGWRPQ